MSSVFIVNIVLLLNNWSDGIIPVVLDLMLKHLRHAFSLPFCFCRFFTNKEFLHCFYEQFDPSLKMLFFYRQLGVWPKGTTVISVLFQQHCLPEPVHFFQMCWPSVLYFVVENVLQ